MKKKVILCYLVFFSLFWFSYLILAVVCTDSFNTDESTIQICAYCSEENGTICSSSRSCNMTVYYSNFTIFLDGVVATNNGDGSFTYNVSKPKDGSYFGELYCGPRSRDDLSFTVGTPTKLGAGYSRKVVEVRNGEIIITNETRNRIPEDINYYLEYGASKLTPSNKKRGKIIIISLLLLFIFFPEIYKFTKNIKIKEKW